MKQLKYKTIEKAEKVKVGDFLVDPKTQCVEGLVVDIVNLDGVSLEDPLCDPTTYAGSWDIDTKTYIAESDDLATVQARKAYIPFGRNQ